HLQVRETPGEPFGESGAGIGNQVVEALPPTAVSGQGRGDQVPAAAPPPTVSAPRALAGTGCSGTQGLDVPGCTRPAPARRTDRRRRERGGSQGVPSNGLRRACVDCRACLLENAPGPPVPGLLSAH